MSRVAARSRAGPRRWRALAAFVFAILLATVGGAGQGRAVDLEVGRPADLPGRAIAYIEDRDGRLTLEQALAAFDAGSAAPVPGDTVDFGNVFSTFWLFVRLDNAGDAPGTWHAALFAPFFPAVAVWVRHADGSLTATLDTSVHEPFDRRPVPHRSMISGPFTLQPGEPAVLAIRFTAGGAAVLPFSLESEASLRSMLERDAVFSTAFYVFSLGSILFFAVFSYAVRAWTGLYYAVLFAFGTLLNAQIDGLTFQFLWPSWPQWNAIASLVLWYLVCAVGFLVAAAQRDSEAPSPRFRLATRGLAAVSIAVNALIPVVEPGVLVVVGYMLWVVMMFAQVVALLPLLRRPTGGLGTAGLVGVLAVAVAAATLVGMFIAGVPLPPFVIYNAHRIVYLVTSLVTMAILLGFVLQLRRDHQSALQREVAAARRDAALNRELFESEKNYARARGLAALRQRQLASATHDIRQPLASLRLSLDSLVADRDSAVRARLKESFDYLEGLTGTYLAEARGEPEDAAFPEHADEPDDAPADTQDGAQVERTEPYPLSLITGTVEQMFREEAVSKGLAFKVVGSDAQVAVPVLPLMRLVSNLVANAVKYTGEGHVSVTAGATAEAAFVVVEDSGPGMAPAALAEFRRAGRKGEASQGEGLGLAIADEVAARLGIAVEADSAPGRGTRFTVRLPAT
ncbi:MAG: 7TM-DISM domain-containing protein [Alphaproteobacteria bacterium]